MEYDSTIIRNKTLRTVLPLFFSVLTILTFLLMCLTAFSGLKGTLLTIGIFCLIITGYLTTKYYNWSLLSFMVVIVSIYFKRNHWPFASFLMATGTLLLGSISLNYSVKMLRGFRSNIFLNCFGVLTGFIVVLFMTGLLYMNLHWSGFIRATFIYAGCFLFFLTVFAMVFTLPFSNYVTWMDVDRKVFYRTILIPMLFIFGLFILIFIFPDYYNSLMGRNVNYIPWINVDAQIQLFNLEGIPAY